MRPLDLDPHHGLDGVGIDGGRGGPIAARARGIVGVIAVIGLLAMIAEAVFRVLRGPGGWLVRAGEIVVAIAAVYAIWFGLSYGGIVSLMPAICMDMFGARAVASIVGTLYSAAAFGNLLGPIVLAPLFDTVGRKPLIAGTYILSGTLLLMVCPNSFLTFSASTSGVLKPTATSLVKWSPPMGIAPLCAAMPSQ